MNSNCDVYSPLIVHGDQKRTNSIDLLEIFFFILKGEILKGPL